MQTNLEKARRYERLALLICLACIFLLLYTAGSKLAAHDRFLRGLLKVKLLNGFGFYVSWLVPASELIVAALLVFPRTVKWGLYTFITLMTVFTGYILANLIWAKKLPCHCGGAIERLSWGQHIWFNLGFIAAAVLALWLIKQYQKFKNQ